MEQISRINFSHYNMNKNQLEKIVKYITDQSIQAINNNTNEANPLSIILQSLRKINLNIKN